jgi:hypothetical protein
MISTIGRRRGQDARDANGTLFYILAAGAANVRAGTFKKIRLAEEEFSANWRTVG